jgi:hypothetical protein
MAATHHDHHVAEQKPVSFTVPLILALVTLVILFAFLSLCDPRPHGHGEQHGKDMPAGHKHATEQGQSHGDPSGPPAHSPAPGGH